MDNTCNCYTSCRRSKGYNVNLYKTKGDITANIEYTSPVTVTENDGNTFAKIENNGTNNVTVTATQPTKVTMKWTDNGAEKSKILNITNNEIKPIKPKLYGIMTKMMWLTAVYTAK